MFDILFGWPKASKWCKRTITSAKRRIRELKNKRLVMAKHLHQDMIELLNNINGHEDIALNKAAQLYQDKSLIRAYGLLDHYCDFILKNLSFIRRHKKCPDDVNEAVSSLIFASARCGSDLPELYVLRKLFGQRYGDQFVTASVELSSGNLVNKELKEILRLPVIYVPEHVKHRKADEEQPEILAIQQSQVEEENKQYQIVPSETFTVPESTSSIDASSALVVSSFQQEEEFTTEKISIAVSDYSENKGEIMALVPSTEALNLPPLDDETDVDQEQKSSHIRKSRMLFENQCLMDIGHYHRSPGRSSSSSSSDHKYGYTQKRIKQCSNIDMCQCSLDQPCYCFVYYDEDNFEALSNKQMELVTNTNDGYNGAFGELLLTYPGFHHHGGKPKTELVETLETSSNSRTKAHVTRAATMPPERHNNRDHKILRTYSLSPKQPKHVHPKLPEYEDIYAKFTALKRERLETKDRKQ
ncbi:uncharacterized protein LOC107477935 [Arachis duranensis]|uniref:Uncharacterized protein LOC107477935 n=1 Tax=Arachis duranensis TaxID=130453 RepID=A0A6P4CN11_ARADU|nr:uncharacterized protein LOC107477935 [Arachis duranensis]